MANIPYVHGTSCVVTVIFDLCLMDYHWFLSVLMDYWLILLSQVLLAKSGIASRAVSHDFSKLRKLNLQ